MCVYIDIYIKITYICLFYGPLIVCLLQSHFVVTGFFNLVSLFFMLQMF